MQVATDTPTATIVEVGMRDGLQILTASADGTARLWDSVSVADRYKAIGQPLVPQAFSTTQPTN